MFGCCFHLYNLICMQTLLTISAPYAHAYGADTIRIQSHDYGDGLFHRFHHMHSFAY